MKMTGAQIIVKLLERQGIKIIAGIPGGANLPIYDALSRQNRIRHVLTRHEQGAGFIAQGLARISGQPQVCLATSGPGATNVITAIADAKLDSIPVICITGQVPMNMIGTDAFQEVDTYGISVPITKHNFFIRSAKDLCNVIPEAFRIAASKRPGPVLIDVPKDIQLSTLEVDHWPSPGRSDLPPRFDSKDLNRAAELIAASRKPVLYAGGGVIGSGASDWAITLSEKATIPMTMTLMGLGVMAPDHPLYLGMLGMHAARYTNLAIKDCDLLIAAGVRFDDRATGRLETFCPNAKVIHMDIDPSEVHKLRSANVGIVGDVKSILKALIPLVPRTNRPEWVGHILNLKRRFPSANMTAHSKSFPASLIKSAAALLDPDTIIVTDVGQHQMWTAQYYPFKHPRQLLTSGGLGTMGFGLPTAIGAALANPLSQVVCFSGDGSLMMNIQELATAVEQKVNIKIILMNNNALGLVQQQQDLFYDRRIYASGYHLKVDFIKIAEGFGIKTFNLTKGDDLVDTLGKAFDQKGPCLIHVPIDPAERVYPMVPPGAANIEMIGGDYDIAN
jgi:acetolactate synthase-1/2/3 large subunit